MGEIDALATAIAADVARLRPLIPTGPAATLGRLRQAPPRESAPFPRSRAALAMSLDGSWESAEQALPALAPALDTLTTTVPPGLRADVLPPPTGPFTTITFMGAGPAEQGFADVEAVHRGATDVIADLTATLAAHPALADALAGPGSGDEETVSAHHGAAHLALGVAVAAAVLRRLIPSSGHPAAVAAGAAAAALLIPTLPEPDGYAEAALEAHRAEYPERLNAGVSATTTRCRFTIVEQPLPADADPDFSGNGLVTEVDGGIAIRTGVADGRVSVSFRAQREPATPDVRHADEVAEVSWTAPRGGATLDGAPLPDLRWMPARMRPFHAQPVVETPPWPGDYRALVEASSRDGDETEHYSITVWPAPRAPQVVHKRTDRLGHRLRGEPEPDRPTPPWAHHRWVEDSDLAQASTVTVVTGTTRERLLTALGSSSPPVGPAERERVRAEADHRVLIPWIAFAEVADGVFALWEDNGHQCAAPSLLARLSGHGRAASMFWTVGALTTLSFAERGRVLISFEPFSVPDGCPDEVRALLDGLDVTDHRHRAAKGLTAVERFTGHGYSPADHAAVLATAAFHRVGE
ncbi:MULTISPECIES: DUF6461 domain-containing protein [Actinosynnema]|uniref:DUF6461 domain-containing protein n=1 Tax=Actinosynnema TaxID=40566 RepID=UPI0020A4CBC9|nr:DUF6461 domain-containing protein [Actinosynnema pretiosum]MCP2099731.1 hypothetical protein [Actinosynnema pretiosum]